MTTTIGVLGAGSWGTALAAHLAARGGHSVLLWSRREDFARSLAEARENVDYLPGVELPESVRPTHRLEDFRDVAKILVVVPSHGFRSVVRSLLEVAHPEILISATKGIETETLARMSEVCFEEALAADLEVRFACLAGPSFAAELARDVPTAAVVATDDDAAAADLREALATPTFRIYSSTDVVGVELGGATKNVIAIAAGVIAGLEFGHNTLAALLTRGLHEITRLGLACGGRPRTFAGLGGMGDLVLTCTGGLSRNRQLGVDLAAGKTRQEIDAASPMVAEGVRNSLAIARLAEKKGVEMPITEQMVQVLYHGKEPRAAVVDLMTRELKAEAEL